MKTKFFTTKFFLLTIIPTFILSCSGHYLGPESFEDKIDRYKGVEWNKIDQPEIPILALDYQKSSPPGNRAPAGLNAKIEEKNQTSQEEFINTSNRQIYFIALYSQFQKMRQLFRFPQQNELPKLQQCPSFHSQFLELNTKTQDLNQISITSKLDYVKNAWIKLSRNEIPPSLLPEFGLRMGVEGPGQTVGENLTLSRGESGAQSLTSALNHFLQKNLNELRELCEYGSGENYYIFENLITHFREHSEIHRTSSGMQALMKTSLFSNMAIIKALEELDKSARFPASYSFYNIIENEIYIRLNANWSRDYFSELLKRRKNLLASLTVENH